MGHCQSSSVRRAVAAWVLSLSTIAGAAPPLYGIEIVDSPGIAARAINRHGDVVGVMAEWPCGDHTLCAPEQRTAVWRGGRRTLLPGIGTLPLWPAAIDDRGWIAGSASDFATQSHAVVWQPVDSGYELLDLGTLPGDTQAAAAGLDAHGRVVGHSTGNSGWRPFVWTAEGGMLDLSLSGFPAERPQAVSPAGWVVSDGHSYMLDDVASVEPLPPAPPGFYPPSGQSLKINDRRELAGFLIATSGQNLLYLHRYRPAQGEWQLLSSSPTGHLSRGRIASIAKDATVSATVTSVGVIAEGPDGLAEPLDAQISPAYPGVDVTDGGPRNARGVIAALAIVGRSQRLVRLLPLDACTGDCLHVDQLRMAGKFVPDPDDPDGCTPLARNKVRATVTVSDANGVPRAGVKVVGRFLDDYALNRIAHGTTATDGTVTLRHEGPACVGAVAFFIDALKAPGATFDRRIGRLTDYVIPLP